MIFISEDQKLTVELNISVEDQIRYYSKFANGKETGGILIGKYSDDLSKAIISLASGAPPDSTAGRTWFARGVKGLRKLLDKCHKTAGSYYLGEWHYHPFASPQPSGHDIKQMIAIARDTKYNCPEPIMIILGGNPESHDYLLYVCIFLRSATIIKLNKYIQRSDL